MLQLGDGLAFSINPQCCQEGIIIKRFRTNWGFMGRLGKKPLMIEGLHQCPAIRLPLDALQTHGMEARKNIMIFPLLWSVAVVGDKALNLFKTRQDLFSRGARLIAAWSSTSTPNRAGRASSSR